ncbi:hypothetical protein [Microbacterium sp. CIAB417]|uniref:hypothetical protein n=1 Tax=Microbacterium sp. CIAB417 TaxID=2860287 RepID=UPI001FACA1E8|nr:hypothetical protein [Microbacterium sp. CIAB417]
MKPVVRAMKDALDGVPVHVRQLSEMFRKHGNAHRRSNSEVNDLDRVPPELRAGWKTDSWHTPDRVVGAGKPNRPYPAEYLDSDYIRQHLARFDGGATRFYRAESLGNYGPGNQGTTFVFPTSEIDNIIDQAGGDPRRLGEMLGLGEDFFVDSDGNAVDIVRADFSFEEIMNGNLRMPQGNEAGANAQWIPGGYLPEGLPEAVFNVSDMGTGTYTQFYVD